MAFEATPSMLEIAPSARGQTGPLVPPSLFLVACCVLWATGLLPGWEAVASGDVRERRYGSRLLLMRHAMSASTGEILSAVQRWGRVTVSDRRPARRS